MSRMGYPHQYQGYVSHGRFNHLQNRGDGVGQAVEGLAGVFEAEDAELVVTAFQIVKSEVKRAIAGTCGCCCSRWKDAAFSAWRTRGRDGRGRREELIADH